MPSISRKKLPKVPGEILTRRGLGSGGETYRPLTTRHFCPLVSVKTVPSLQPEKVPANSLSTASYSMAVPGVSVIFRSQPFPDFPGGFPAAPSGGTAREVAAATGDAAGLEWFPVAAGFPDTNARMSASSRDRSAGVSLSSPAEANSSGVSCRVNGSVAAAPRGAVIARPTVVRPIFKRWFTRRCSEESQRVGSRKTAWHVHAGPLENKSHRGSGRKSLPRFTNLFHGKCGTDLNFLGVATILFTLSQLHACQ